MAQQYSVIIEAPAYDDLRDIFRYIAVDSPMVAYTIHGQLLEQMRSLEQFPFRHQIILVVHGYEIRHLVFKGGFRVLYTVQGNQVHVLHCLRSEQNVDGDLLKVNNDIFSLIFKI